MKSIFAVVPVCLLVGCTETSRETSGDPEAPNVATVTDPGIDLLDPGLVFGAPIQEGSLTLWPVIRTGDAPELSADEAVSCLTLDDALAAGQAEVLETGNVSQLQLVNHSSTPVLLLAGEVLDGGQQDRIVACDTLVAGGETVPLASFCVEQGRWQTEEGDASDGRKFRSAAAFAGASVRRAAQVSKAQQAVWSNVAYLTSVNGSRTSTGTYMAVLENDEVKEAVDRRATAVLTALEGVDAAVGLVTALDYGSEDEIVAAEIFRDARLFAAYREKLVRACVLDAVTREKAGELPASDPLGPLDSLDSLRSLGYIATDSREPAMIAERDPDLVVTEDSIEAGSADLKHLHRTLYMQ